ncbi:glycosyltransferase family 2 protein [Brevibacillus sp. SYSU BS000544]|uniref:glycosyltransferase family 2 protein n=1 Tax=Brevibacillus sp. SYSU BS000544 TaxID=3416443 RepID=UPI003CE4DAFC
MKKVSIIVPAYNEADRIMRTLQAIRLYIPHHELIVVDDGSRDNTMDVASQHADLVVRLPLNKGKGVALQTGWRQADGDIIVMLDADLCESARFGYQLIEPVLADHCDMSVAQLPKPPRKTGMGLAKGLARTGIRMLTGYEATSPLSGQRAIRREALDSIKSLDWGFGVEVGMTVDILRAGFRVQEVPVNFTHRFTGNDFRGYWHRGKEFVAIGRALGKKFREGTRGK